MRKRRCKRVKKLDNVERQESEEEGGEENSRAREGEKG